MVLACFLTFIAFSALRFLTVILFLGGGGGRKRTHALQPNPQADLSSLAVDPHTLVACLRNASKSRRGWVCRGRGGWSIWSGFGGRMNPAQSRSAFMTP